MWKSVALKAVFALVALLPSVFAGYFFTVLMTTTFGLRNYGSIGGFSMWFLLCFVVTYSALLWAAFRLVNRRMSDWAVKKAAGSAAVAAGVEVASVRKWRGFAFHALVVLLVFAGLTKGLDTYMYMTPLGGPVLGWFAAGFSVAIIVFVLVQLFRGNPRIYVWIIALGLWSFQSFVRYESIADLVVGSVLLLSIISLSFFLFLKQPGSRERLNAFRARFDTRGNSLIGGWYNVFLTVLYAALAVPFFVPVTVLDGREVTLTDMAVRYGIVIPALLLGGGTAFGLWTIWGRKLLWNTAANMVVAAGMVALFFQMSHTAGIPDSTPNRVGLYPLIICPSVLFIFSLLFGATVKGDVSESERPAERRPVTTRRI
jgi:hypothetical protein